MHPILLKIPFIDLPIYSYGVMLGLSLVVGWYLVMYLGKRDGFPVEILTGCYIWTAVSAILGARILYVIANFEGFTDGDLLDIINFRKGGLVAYGGFIGGFLGSWIYLRMKKVRLLPWADAVVPALGSGLGITRIGCLLYGCDYGKPIPDDAPGWIKAIGLQFPNWSHKFADTAQQFKEGVGCMTGPFHGSPAFNHHVSMGLTEIHSHASALVYPTQIMEIANGWIAFGLVMFVRAKTKFRGQAFLFFTMYYGLTRSLMEMIRGDTQRGGVGIMSTSQIIGIITFLASVTAWIYLAKRAKDHPELAMDLGPGAKIEAKKEEDSPPVKTKPKRKKK